MGVNVRVIRFGSLFWITIGTPGGTSRPSGSGSEMNVNVAVPRTSPNRITSLGTQVSTGPTLTQSFRTAAFTLLFPNLKPGTVKVVSSGLSGDPSGIVMVSPKLMLAKAAV